jgi:predicted acyltransferase (DUF342 family)
MRLIRLHRFPRSVALTLLASAFFAPGCTIADDYRIPDGAKTQRSYHSIAGAVHIGSNAAIDRVRTVAGKIAIDDGATTHSLSSVAGDIRLGERVRVDGDVSTVAGNIHIGAGTRVSGKVTSIAGTIDLNGCRVDGLVRVTKGSLDTSGPTALPGGILVRHVHSTYDENTPTIDIGSGADVASIEIEPDMEVDLRISRNARVGKVTGAKPTYY